jgi:hypothetical protein
VPDWNVNAIALYIDGRLHPNDVNLSEFQIAAVQPGAYVLISGVSCIVAASCVRHRRRTAARTPSPPAGA